MDDETKEIVLKLIDIMSDLNHSIGFHASNQHTDVADKMIHNVAEKVGEDLRKLRDTIVL